MFTVHKTYPVMNNCRLKEKNSIHHRNLNRPQKWHLVAQLSNKPESSVLLIAGGPRTSLGDKTSQDKKGVSCVFVKRVQQCYSVGNDHDVDVENIELNQMSFFILRAGHALFLSYLSFSLDFYETQLTNTKIKMSKTSLLSLR